MNPQPAQSAFPGSTLGRLQERLFNEGRAKVDPGIGDKTLLIEGSDRRASAFSLYLL
jgi:hypothetical protein